MKKKYLLLLSFIFNLTYSQAENDYSILINQIKKQESILKKSMIPYLNKISNCVVDQDLMNSFKNENQNLKLILNDLLEKRKDKAEDLSEIQLIVNKNKKIVLKPHQIQTIESIMESNIDRKTIKIYKTDSEIMLEVPDDEIFFNTDLNKYSDVIFDTLNKILVQFRNNKMKIEISGDSNKKKIEKLKILNSKFNTNYSSVLSRISIYSDVSLTYIFKEKEEDQTKKNNSFYFTFY